MNKMNTNLTEKQVLIPKESISIGITASLDQFNVPVELSIGLLDKNKEKHVSIIGEYRSNKTITITVPIDKGIVLPAEFLGIYVKTQGGVIGFEQKLFINDIFYMTENNEQKSLDVMENFLNWTPLITSYNFGEDSVSLLNANDNTTKNVVLQYKYKIPKASISQKGILYLRGKQQIPIIIDETTFLEYELSENDTVVLDFKGKLFPAKITDPVKYFPTLGLEEYFQQ